jgi:phosphotransferase system HPr-like phosphotransfer protein
MKFNVISTKGHSKIQVTVDGENEQKAIQDVSEILVDGAGI